MMTVRKTFIDDSYEKKFIHQLTLERELKRSTREVTILERSIEGVKGGSKEYKAQERLKVYMTNEYTDVLTDLAVATSPNKKGIDDRLTGALYRVLDESDNFGKAVEKQNDEIQAIEKEIIKFRQKIKVIEPKVLSEKQHTERWEKGIKNLVCLENKLGIATKQYCAVTYDNKVLRQEIDFQLVERISFNKLWNTYLKNLYNGKRIMLDMIEQSTIAYNTRDEYITTLKALRSWSYESFSKDRKEIEYLQKNLDHQQQIHEFLTVKNQRRSLFHLEMKKANKLQKTRSDMMETLSRYKEMLNEIKRITKLDVEKDKESFIYYFQLLEDYNITNVYMINDLRRDHDYISETVIEAQYNMEQQILLNEQRAIQQVEKIEALQERLAKETLEADTDQERLDMLNGHLNNIYDGIKYLFDLCNCNKTPFQQLLGDNAEINDYNVFYFFEALEDGVNDLLLNVYSEERQMDKKIMMKFGIINQSLFPDPIYKIDRIVKTNPCPLCVDREMVKNVIDTLQFVQEKEDVEHFLKQRLKSPDALERLHNVSACKLPQSRAIIQRRYQ